VLQQFEDDQGGQLLPPAGRRHSGFWNPALTALVYQFRRFKIDLHTAFAYTGQPGYAALSAADKTAFETQLNAITAQYKLQNPASTFDAIAWLKALLPANYSKTVLILQDPDSGCNFNSTKLQYADGSSATPLDLRSGSVSGLSVNVD